MGDDRYDATEFFVWPLPQPQPSPPELVVAMDETRRDGWLVTSSSARVPPEFDRVTANVFADWLSGRGEERTADMLRAAFPLVNAAGEVGK
jgi:hypothetical protein